MNPSRFFVFALALSLAQFSLAPVVKAKGEFNVRAYGATGDGTTKDTAAFQKALDACASAGGGTVVVPAGDYLMGSIVIGINTTVQLESRAYLVGSPDIADYPMTQVRFEGEFVPGHRALISAENKDNVAVIGRGFIIGPPLTLSLLRNPRGPVLIEFTGCTNVTLDGFTTQYQRLWSIHPLFCRKVVAKNLTIRSVAVNGDGIDVDSCRDVLIEHCDINTGDDAIALKSGRGLAAVRLNRPTEDVTIKDCTLVSSTFAGLAVGTELSGGIRNVEVKDCLLSGRQNGIFLKSRDGRGGYIENFTGKNLTVRNSPTFLDISLLKLGIQASDPVTADPEKWTRLSHIRFDHIRVDNVAHLVLANDIPSQRPVSDFSLTDVQGTCAQALNLANMTNVVLADIHVTDYHGPFLTKVNVQGRGLTHSN
ncbi:MAG TPA: glycoside hydrolase family 28 protein [Verrucomicrobiae bacterium]|nr:glycoside hydrolase family 28 protein [Verrucomicrobiae bacterium]